MIVIGVTGQIGSGKDTFSNYLVKIAKGKRIVRMRFSDLLRETLDLWSLPQTRHNLQYLAIIMDKEYGKGTLTNAIRERIRNQKADMVILEGVRWKSDIDLINSFENHLLVYVTADQKIRFERVRKRSEKVDENNLTFNRFKAEDNEETETHISEIGKRANIKIENNGSLEDFQKEIEKIYREIKRGSF